MKLILLLLSFIPSLALSGAKTTKVKAPKPVEAKPTQTPKVVVPTIDNKCYEFLSALPGKYLRIELMKACAETSELESCVSEQGRPVFHYEKKGSSKKGKRILTYALIHGDETSGGSIARAWMERLVELSPRNTWRIIPILNPDGHLKKTRTNINGVDINRNFPTKQWDKLAKKFWKKRYKASKRKFPGNSAASEKETVCAIDHFHDFKPDLVIAIHTPYGLLDFDGPHVKFPKFKGLPWRRLGNYPGSMGRYMWRDHRVPVLTIELKGDDGIRSFKAIDKLQDISGLLAIRANTKKNVKKKKIRKNSKK